MERSGAAGPIEHAISLGLIGSIAWLAVALLEALDDLVAHQFPIDVSDNLLARQMRTEASRGDAAGSDGLTVFGSSLAAGFWGAAANWT